MWIVPKTSTFFHFVPDTGNGVIKKQFVKALRDLLGQMEHETA